MGWAWHRCKTPERVTDQEGRCPIEIPREFFGLLLWSTKDGFAPCSGDIRRQGDRGLVHLTDRGWVRQEVRQGLVPTVTLKLEPGEPIGGLVKDDKGRPIRGAEVTVAFGQHSAKPDADLLTPSNWSAAWRFPLCPRQDRCRGPVAMLQPACGPPSEQRLAAPSVVHPDYVSDTGGFKRQLSLRTARAMTGVLVMKSGASVSGQIRDSKGKPVAGARVVLAYSNDPTDFSRDKDGCGGSVCLSSRRRPSPVVALDHRGRGRRVLAGLEGHSPKREAAARGVQPVAGQAFYGRVVDRQGQPIAGIEVRPRWDYFDHLSWRAVSDAEGRFIWRDAPQDGDMEFDLEKEGELPEFAKVCESSRRANLTYDPERH